MRTMMLALVLTGVALAACGGSGSDGAAPKEDLVLRGYPAPGRAEELASAIGYLLRLGEQRVGSARVGPADQVLVLAPRSVHEGIEELVREQPSPTEAPARPSSVSMTYWFVGARPGADAAPRAPALKEIEPALTEVTRLQGPHEFRLIERLQLRQLPGGGDYSADSPNLKVLQSVSLSRGEIVAWVRAVPAGRNEIKTQVKLRSGQLMVLAQVGLDEAIDPFPRKSRTPAGFDRALYLVIRADVDPPA